MIKVDYTPPSAILTLNRPEVRNAISMELIARFEEVLNEVERREDIAAIVLTGEGKAFSAGADIGELRETASQPVEKNRAASLRFMNFFRRLYEFPKPVIAAVNGPAMGGGCGLVTVCDMVVAAKEAVFAYPEVKIGFIPALVAVFLLRACGEKRARELLLTGRTFTAREARDFGLVNEVVSADRLLSRALELGQELARGGPAAMAQAKRLIHEVQGLSLNEALALAAHFNALVRTSEEFQEGVSAFLEKRSPSWTQK
ncbi:MAG: enoyl-CoA hydratase/isomerase family protein [Acidobacteriota bacterium]